MMFLPVHVLFSQLYHNCFCCSRSCLLTSCSRENRCSSLTCGAISLIPSARLYKYSYNTINNMPKRLYKYSCNTVQNSKQYVSQVVQVLLQQNITCQLCCISTPSIQSGWNRIPPWVQWTICSPGCTSTPTIQQNSHVTHVCCISTPTI